LELWPKHTLGQIKRGQLTFLLVTSEMIFVTYKVTNYIEPGLF